MGEVQTGAVTGEDGGEGDSPRGVRLRVEEEFDVFDVLGGGAGEVVVGEVVEVSGGLEDRHVGVVDGEEGGEVVEGVAVGLVEGGEVRREREVVALGEGAGQGWSEAAFEVDVEFGFGEAVDEGGDVGFMVFVVIVDLGAGVGHRGPLLFQSKFRDASVDESAVPLRSSEDHRFGGHVCGLFTTVLVFNDDGSWLCRTIGYELKSRHIKSLWRDCGMIPCLIMGRNSSSGEN